MSETPKAWAILKRRQGVTSGLTPGDYLQTYKNPDTWCMWKCPRCLLVGSIGRAYHDVNYLGEINPMVKCPHCTFQGWVMLEDWHPEAKGRA